MGTPAAQQAKRALELADEAFARSDLEQAVAQLSAAIRGFTAAGETSRAAMTCVQLGVTYAQALGNLIASRAWFARAARLVADEPPCVEQGWVAVAALGCDVDDPAALLAAAELALDLARRFADVNLETKALADAGLAHVQAGRVAEGMALLDEAMALACGPADDTGAAARSVCSFFTACYFAADFERAATWTEPLRRRGLIAHNAGGQIFLSNHCDSVRATLLMELGQWSEAERILTAAQADFAALMGGPSWHPDIALADLRIRQGRYSEAEALLLGKDQALQALLPAARLHVGRGEYDLAQAACRRGLRAVHDDKLRAVELLTLLVDAELARGDLSAAQEACSELTDRIEQLDVVALHARAASARARVLAAGGDSAAAVSTLEAVVDRPQVRQLPWIHASLLVDLARLRETAGDTAAATIDAKAAAALLSTLDVVTTAADAALLDRYVAPRPVDAKTEFATLARDKKFWTLTHGRTSVRLPDTKGFRYVAELVAAPGVERHVLDLVDRIEGVAVDGPDRRALGDAGPVLDARARAAYRQRIEQLRGDAEDALAAGQLEAAEAIEAELEAFVAQLAQAFGLGGRDRRAASAAERARLNVTRALRAAAAKVVEALPEPGAALDRALRTGIYCTYDPAPGDIRWIVQS